MKVLDFSVSFGSRRGREGGFTLLEMMAVVVIIGLVAAIGYPMMHRSVVRARLVSQIGVLKQAVAVARANALKHGQGVTLKFLEANAEQHGGEVVVWFDSDQNGSLDSATESMIGSWPVKNKIILKPDPENLLFKLAGSGRGVLFLGNGTAISNASGKIGVGQGAVVVSDRNQNDIRLLIMGGTGTVILEMWDPGTGTWSRELRHWRF